MSKKVVFIFACLIEDSEAYKGKTNADIEKEILKEIRSFPYLAKIEKVTVLDCNEIEESENCAITNLQKHGLSKTVANNVVRFYRG